ncbi:MAG: uroporphyrinogen-III C-methyltransferase [Chloroflexi bacterium]|nr:uroporphyrinogen-III C-methyltransferase [Chloroflexota bacterium]
MTIAPTGFVWLVGAGPGDPGLITVAAAEALARADVVVYDRLANPVLLDLAPDLAERVAAGKGPGRHTMTQDEINALLVERGRAGKRVVRLKGGDPFVFGRGGEEAEALSANAVPFAVIPGISSAVAAPAYAGIPVTHRGVASSVTFVTGREDPAKESHGVDWQRLAGSADTIVLLMGAGQLAEIVERLTECGRDAETPVAVVEWGTLPRQRTVTGTLRDIVELVRDAGIGAPSVIVVGEVVRLRDSLRWFDTRPLFGLRVLVTRTRQHAGQLSKALMAAGAEAIELPAIAITPRYDEKTLAAAVDSMKAGRYDWLIFTSTNAVDIFFSFLDSRQLDTRSVQAKVAVIGAATAAALQSRGIAVDVTPERFTAEGLLAALPDDLAGRRVLVPRAENARPLLIDELRDRGATVDEETLYVAAPPDDNHPHSGAAAEALRLLRAGEVDVATFASASSVTSLAAILGDDLSPLRRCRIACIGPVTAARFEELLGQEPEIVAEEHTIPGLVTAIEEAETSRV